MEALRLLSRNGAGLTAEDVVELKRKVAEVEELQRAVVITNVTRNQIPEHIPFKYLETIPTRVGSLWWKRENPKLTPKGRALDDIVGIHLRGPPSLRDVSYIGPEGNLYICKGEFYEIYSDAGEIVRTIASSEKANEVITRLEELRGQKQPLVLPNNTIPSEIINGIEMPYNLPASIKTIYFNNGEGRVLAGICDQHYDPRSIFPIADFHYVPFLDTLAE
jgi:hypothetical protein